MSLTIGEIRIDLLSDGHMLLDGGAMFGVVPKIMWEKRAPADERNRISLGLISALVRTPRQTILIEAGIGDQLPAKARAIYNPEQDERLLAGLAAIGVKTADIDMVIFSHLHFDHIGHATRVREDGKVVPTFEKAQYVVQRREWEAACAPCARNRASYLPNLFRPFETSGQLMLVDGDVEIAQGVRGVLTGGHSHGHQALFIESRGEGAVFWGDLIPTSAHVDYPFIMAYDLFPLDTLAHKERLIPFVVERGYACIWTHEPTCRWGRILPPPDGKQHRIEWP